MGFVILRRRLLAVGIAVLSFLLQLAFAFLLEFAPFAFEFLVGQSLRDALFRAPLRDLHLRLNAPFHLIYRGGFARLLLRLHLIWIN